MKNSPIEWTDDTRNVVEGCSMVDTDCRGCYAMGIAARFSQPHKLRRESDGAPMGEGKPGHYDGLARYSPGRRMPQWTGKVRLRLDVLDDMFWQLLRAKESRRQFLCSMGDLFHAEVPDAFLDEVFARIAILESRSIGHPFYLLTKRPERAAEYTNVHDVVLRLRASAQAFIGRERIARPGESDRSANRRREMLPVSMVPDRLTWPLRSVVLITSVGTQAGADARVPWLLRCKAAAYGVSCEPLTGSVDLTNICGGPGFAGDRRDHPDLYWNSLFPTIEPGMPVNRRLNWVIVGGESGDLDAREQALRPRPCELAWMESLVEQARSAGVAVFVKQLGSELAGRLGREGKGGKLEDFPESLRVRQWPDLK